MCPDALPSATVPERPKTFIKGLIEWFERWSKFKSFWSTRRAIKEGENLFDLSAEDLRQRKLMGPITFNVYQSGFAALPGSALAFLVAIINPSEPAPPTLPANVDDFTKAWVTEAARVAPDVQKVFAPFLPPLILLLVAWISARACIKRRDSTREKRIRCRNAHLYFDGTFGLWPQTIMATAISLAFLGTQEEWTDTIQMALYVSAGVLVIFALPYIFYLSYRKFPKLLFALNGYSQENAKLSDIWRRRPENAAPWHKYTLSMMFGAGMVSWLFILLILLLEVSAVRYISFVRVWIRFYFQHKL